jgi:hypothetical protein
MIKEEENKEGYVIYVGREERNRRERHREKERNKNEKNEVEELNLC